MIELSKNCPECGEKLPDEARFCMNCGYDFSKKDTTNNIFTNGKIFLVIIAFVVILGLIVIATTGNITNLNHTDNAEHVDLTISEVGGWMSGTSYSLYTKAIFNSVPSDKNGYTVKTTYYDANNTEIGHETEKLDKIYYDSQYAITFGYYTSYQLPDVDHVGVEIIKDGKVIDTYTEKVDRNKIEFLNEW